MNTLNASTNFTGFQLHLGRSPRVIPPLVPATLPAELQDAVIVAADIINKLQNNVSEACDNLLYAKIQQSHHSCVTSSPDTKYKLNDMVMLLTTNRRREYKKKGEKRTTKFFPHWDGPFHVTDVHPEASTYTLDIPTNAYPVYHASELKLHLANNPLLFPNRQLPQPGLMVTKNGLKKFAVDEIIDSRCRGRDWQFLVRWLWAST